MIDLNKASWRWFFELKEKKYAITKNKRGLGRVSTAYRKESKKQND